MAVSLTVNRRLSAPPERVYRAWTDPATYKAWFKPTRLIFRAGVDELFHWDAQFEGRGWPHNGRWLRLEKPRLLEMTWVSEATQGMESIVRVELKPQGSGTDLTLTHSNLPDEKSRKDHERGWTSIVASLDDLPG